MTQYYTKEELVKAVKSLKVTKKGKAHLKWSDRKEKKDSLSIEEKEQVEDLFNKVKYMFKEKTLISEKPKIITIDLLEGLTIAQKVIIRYLVEEKGFNPLGFVVLVEEDRIFYYGEEILR